MASLKDIAEQADCSVGLVSRVLSPISSQHVRVSDQKRHLIVETARLMGYRRNPGAQFLRRGQSGTIGVFLLGSRRSGLILDCSIGICEAASQYGIPTDFHYGIAPSNFAEFLDRNIEGKTAGIIASAYLIELAESDRIQAKLREYIKNGGKAVFINYHGPRDVIMNSPCVNVDDEYGGRIAAERLLNHDCDEYYALVVEQERNNSYARLRSSGFRNAMKEHEQKLEEVTLPKVLERLDKAFTKGRTAGVFAFTDRSALELMRDARCRLNMHAGRDYKLIGCDNAYLSDLTDPPLTTIDQHFHEVGRQAAKKLCRMSCNGHHELSVNVLPEIVPRATS